MQTLIVGSSRETVGGTLQKKVQQDDIIKSASERGRKGNMAFMFISHFITEADIFYCSCSSSVSFLSDCFSSLNSHVILIRHAESHCWGCNLETKPKLLSCSSDKVHYPEKYIIS